LLREQCANWEYMAGEHIDSVGMVCSKFLKRLLVDMCAADIESRLWTNYIDYKLRERKENAFGELAKLISEVQDHPINHNHYYTETMAKRRDAKYEARIANSVDAATVPLNYYESNVYKQTEQIDKAKVIKLLTEKHEADMEDWACNEALECLLAIYKVSNRHYST
jgi:hypothetical protein